MTATDSFDALLEQFRTDTDDAARNVFHRYSGRLIALARRQVDPRLAHRIDPEEVVQSAFKSFFIRHRAGTLQIGAWHNIWSLLVRITLCKCADRVEYLQARRRDVRREVFALDGADLPRELALDREPSPDEAAVLAETIKELFRSLEDDERPVLELSLQGHTAAEISLRLGRAIRTIHRIRERIHRRLQSLHAE